MVHSTGQFLRSGAFCAAIHSFAADMTQCRLTVFRTPAERSSAGRAIAPSGETRACWGPQIGVHVPTRPENA